MRSAVKIRLAGDNDRARWDAYADKLPNTPPLSRYGWKRVLEESYGAKTFFLFALDGETVRGILPLYLTRDLRGRKRFFSLKFGLAADTEEARNGLLSCLKKCMVEQNAVSSLITTGYGRIGTGLSEITKKTVVIELGADEGATWKSLRDKTRNMIRRGQKSGIVAERGFGNLKSFYRIYSENMLQKGIPIHSYKFFRSIAENFDGSSELIVAKIKNEVIGGALALFSKDMGIYPFQSSLTTARKLAPNDFLVWETIRSCLQRRLKSLDMGESSEEGNVYRFKVNFGGMPRSIYYYAESGQSKSDTDREAPARQEGLSFSGRIMARSPRWMRGHLGIWMKRTGRII